MSSAGEAAWARSVLFVPGSRPDRFEKAATSGADLVIVDLEDAVSPTEKVRAREAAQQWLKAGGQGGVRVNGAGTEWHAGDVDALASLPGLRAVMVPRAEDPQALAAIHRTMGHPVQLVALVETAMGLTRVAELARCEGVVRLAFGHLDFAEDIGSDTGEVAMLYARSAIVVASRSAGLYGPIDGVTTALDDPARAGADARYASTLGFAGKLCVHPTQVATVNAAFSPDPAQIAWARRILAVSGGRGNAVRIDGHMVDAPLVRRAVAICARASHSR